MEQKQENQIVKYNPLLNYPSLTTNDIESSKISDLNRQIIIASQNYPRINRLDEVECHNSLVDILTLAIWETGFAMNEIDQKSLITYMIDEIESNYDNLTLEEIKIALKRGVRGKYGDVFGANVRMFCSWIDKYVSETKAEAIKQLVLIQSKDNIKEISEEEKKYWHYKWLNLALEAYDEYKENGYTKFIDINNNLYDYIKYKIKLVALTKEETDSIWDKAVQEHKREHSLENAKNAGQIADFRNVILKIQNGDASENEKIKKRAKRIALIKFFEKIKIANIDFKERIKEYEKVDFEKEIQIFVYTKQKEKEEKQKK